MICRLGRFLKLLAMSFQYFDLDAPIIPRTSAAGFSLGQGLDEIEHLLSAARIEKVRSGFDSVRASEENECLLYEASTNIQMRPNFKMVLDQLRLLSFFGDFDPFVIGTPPLGIEHETSDIDIAFCSPDLNQFLDRSLQTFGSKPCFSSRTIKIRGENSAIVTFVSQGWQIELFCQTVPIAQQFGVRHFLIEERILALCPAIRSSIVELKNGGLKTEPAFASILKLEGDPYVSLLELETATNSEIHRLCHQCLVPMQIPRHNEN